jgi:hypothetical protein
LDYLCERFGPNTVKNINLALKDTKYTPNLWLTISSGIPVETLWEDYRKAYNLHPKKPDNANDQTRDGDHLAVAKDEATVGFGRS